MWVRHEYIFMLTSIYFKQSKNISSIQNRFVHIYIERHVSRVRVRSRRNSSALSFVLGTIRCTHLVSCRTMNSFSMMKIIQLVLHTCRTRYDTESVILFEQTKTMAINTSQDWHILVVYYILIQSTSNYDHRKPSVNAHTQFVLLSIS
jgi:hypothetical protein